MTQKGLSSSRSGGWSNERSHGSVGAGVSPKIGRISTERRSHFCASLQSGSCSENYAIPHDLSGQTLRSGAGSLSRHIAPKGKAGSGVKLRYMQTRLSESGWKSLKLLSIE